MSLCWARSLTSHWLRESKSQQNPPSYNSAEAPGVSLRPVTESTKGPQEVPLGQHCDGPRLGSVGPWVSWRALRGPLLTKVQRAFVLRQKPICLPVTQGSEYFCLSNFMPTFAQSATFQLPTRAQSWCQNSHRIGQPVASGQ